MKKADWMRSLGCLILGLPLMGGICHADPTAPQVMQGSPAALYNAGNSDARQGKTALAVLNYERARLLAPRDADIQANLRHERESASLPTESSFENRFRVLSPNAAYWLGLTGLAIAGASALLLLLRKSPRTAWAATLAAGVFMMTYTVGDAAFTARLMREAVVMQSASAGASPIVNAETLFTVPPATLVQIQDEHGNFMLIRDSQGQVGWVPRGQITRVINTGENFHA